MSSLFLDPMPSLREKATVRINSYFASLIDPRESIWRIKRTVAYVVQNGGTVPDEFAAEADLRGLSALELADLILSKEDPAPGRELARQRALFAVENAESQPELDAILSSLNAG